MGRDLLCRMRGRLVSEGLSLTVLSLADDHRQLPCGDDYKKYVVHLDSGFAIHCKTMIMLPSCREANLGFAKANATSSQALYKLDFFLSIYTVSHLESYAQTNRLHFSRLSCKNTTQQQLLLWSINFFCALLLFPL